MEATWARIAALLRRLGWCFIFQTFFSVRIDGISLAAIPACAAAVVTLVQLAPLLDRPSARRLTNWAAVASGVAALAAVLQWLPDWRDGAGAAYWLIGSVAASLYALGLAAWTAPVDGGAKVAQRLRRSVAAWVACNVLVFVAWLGGDPRSRDEADGATMFGDRVVDWPWFVVAAVLGTAALWLLVTGHHIVRSSLAELTAEGRADPSPAPSELPA